MNKLSFEVRGAVAVLTLDNPPVNSLGHELRQAIVAGVARANADPNIGALVLIGSGAGFSGGADIREFGTPKA
ncbi:MAG: enoyl-CoA hydratase-related protein, partial [Steroidobacteraceae bacterium]